jgi:uncharacterized protein
MLKDTELTRAAEAFARKELARDTTGHDWWHVAQVRKNALLILEHESDADGLVVELAALLHDIADSKMHGGDHSVGPKKAGEWLQAQGLDAARTAHICSIIEKQSFSAKAGKLPTKEGQIVQDADRLEAMGATGIARCFAYGGSKGRLIYDPDMPNGMHSIQHFHDKLLRLKALMNTETGKRLAAERHNFMKAFLNQFYSEWGIVTPEND